MAEKQDISRSSDGSELSSPGGEYGEQKISNEDNHSPPEEMLRIIRELSLHQTILEQHQKEIGKSLDLYSELYDFAPVGYLTLTRDGRIGEANRIAKKMIGAEYALLTGIPFKRFVAAEYHPAIEALLDRVFSTIVPAFVEVILLPTGSSLPQLLPHGLTVQITVRLDAVMSYSSSECRVILSDITERKQAQEILSKNSTGFMKLFHEHVNIMLLIDPDTGNIIGANMAAAAFYGRSIHELRLMSIRDINALPPESVNRDLAKYRVEKQYRFTRTHRKADGSIRDVDVASNIIEIDGKELFVSIINDITDRKKAEKLLNRSEERFRTMFEQHSAIMLLIDSDSGNIIDANMAAAAFYGWSTEELKGMRIQQINTLPSEEVLTAMEKSRKGEQNFYLFHHRRKDGSICDVELHSSTFTIKGQNLLYSIIHDITERKQAEKEGERIQSAFLSNVSHELRSPIHGILGLADLLKEPDITPDDQVKYIGLIRHAGEILLHLVNDLIESSRVEAGQIRLQIAHTMVNQLMRELHVFYEVQTKTKGLQFYCTTALDDDESIIETDRLRVSQILTNLIHNALKFTNTGSIHIGYERKNGSLEFYCVDSGCGIPAAMKEKIFDRFQKVENSSIQNSEGAGLGLNISKSLTSLLGGTIGVESEEGKGSRFFFTLPYNPPNAVRSPIRQEPSRSLAGITILLAEDNKVSELLMRAILQKENMTILSAENGQVALELAASHPEIDVVLMDINMPVMNGFEATRKIKKMLPDLPVIAQTAHCSMEDQKKAKRAGCDGFICKPIKTSELLGLIIKLLTS